MYINFSLVNEKGLGVCEVITLQLLKQLRNELIDISDYLPLISCLPEIYVERLKDGSPRLSKKGAEILELIQIPNASENHAALAEYLIEKYKDDPDKMLCSREKLISLIAWFCGETSLTPRELYKVLIEYWKSDDSKFNRKLDYLFFKPESAYSKRNINNSRLYIWWQNNK